MKVSDGKPWEAGTASETTPVLMLYCREIGQVKLLEREEEMELLRRAQQGDAAAREQLIKANLRLVVHLAREFEGRGVPLLDLISEGNIGLMRAVDRYDLAKGAKLSVYAAFWIHQRMRRALYRHARLVRVPAYVHARLRAVASASDRLQGTLGRQPSPQELARETGLSARRLHRLREALGSTVSLDAPIGNREGATIAEAVADEQATPPDEALAQAARLEALRQSFEQLVLRSRFGMEGGAESTLDQIGIQIGLCRERVRRIQNEALAKLRKRLTEQDRPRLAPPRLAQHAPPAPSLLQSKPKRKSSSGTSSRRNAPGEAAGL